MKTQKQQEVFELLRSKGQVREPWFQPIYALQHLFGSTFESHNFVKDMQRSGLIELRSVVADGRMYSGLFEWVAPE
jgi:hypothetical protein